MASNYALESLLSPYDFELLVCDLLSAELDEELISFAEGADKGIDLRCYCDKNKKIVVQCKRTTQLTEVLLSSEAEKVKKLDIHEYYLATSKNLSVDKCDRILKVFEKWMNDDGNIYGKNRINNLLDKYPKILRRNCKLWINSTEVFDQYINNDLLGRSRFLVEIIKEDLKYYVRNNLYDTASKTLEDNHFVLISGIPGIGKTTLARILIWEYLSEGYEVIEIRNINEGEKILKDDKDKKQILYFDDFLGENFLGYDVLKGRPSDLLMFLNRISSDENKRLVMTTRENILQQACGKYPKLNCNEIDFGKCILAIDDVTLKHRAEILYNHLYYSGIGKEYICDILKDKNYEKIILHKNFNPRIVEMMTLKLRSNGIEASSYSRLFLEYLEDTNKIWKDAFETQISSTAQILLYVMNSCGSNILIEDFERVYKNYEQSNFNSIVFKKAIGELEGTFIKSSFTYESKLRIEFLNPSVRDFLIAYMPNEHEVICKIIGTSLFWNQLINLYQCILKKDKKYEDAIVEKIISNWDTLEYSGLIQYYGRDNSWHRNNKSVIERLYELIKFFDIKLNDKLSDFIVGQFQRISFGDSNNWDDYNDYFKIVKKVNSLCKIDFNSVFNNFLENMWGMDHLHTLLLVQECFSEEFDQYINLNKNEFYSKIESLICQELSNEEDISTLVEIIPRLEKLEKLYMIGINYEIERINERIDDLNQDNKSKLQSRPTSTVKRQEEECNLQFWFNTDMLEVE